MQIKFKDPAFSFQLLRLLGSAASRQADVGECLATAERIREGDFESWYREWSQIAARLEAVADECARRGHAVSAGDAYLRAANYHRASEFYLHGDPLDPRIQDASDRGARCFEAGLCASGVRFEPIAIPYEGTTLPGIFYSGGEGTRRTLIVQTGFDGTIDSLLPWAQAAARRGWHCLTFEGPGQGRVLRKQGLPFRPDWERVIGRVIDQLATRPDVDRARIALLGLSFGGFLAPRAAAHEPRLAACVANGGVFEFLGPHLPAGMSRSDFAGVLEAAPLQVDAMLYERATQSPQVRWSVENGQYSFQATSPSAWLKKALEYDLAPHVAGIRCPTLVVDVEDDNSFPGEARKLYNALTCEKTWLFFSEAEGAGDHCQTGSPALAQQRVFDWLDLTVSMHRRGEEISCFRT